MAQKDRTRLARTSQDLPGPARTCQDASSWASTGPLAIASPTPRSEEDDVRTARKTWESRTSRSSRSRLSAGYKSRPSRDECAIFPSGMGPSGSPGSHCAFCGQALVGAENFCGHCGATQPAGERARVHVQVPHAPTSSPVSVGAQTLLQIPRPMPATQPAAAPVAPAGPAALAVSKQTMIGVASPFAAQLTGPAAPSAPASAPARQPAPSPAGLSPMNRTMLGVAIPGIAPTRPPDETVPAAPASSPAPQARQRRHAATLPLQVQYVPPPEPLRDLRAPAPPKVVRKKGGFPLAAVALAMGVVVLAGGVALALFWKGAPPITGRARTTPDGKDILHLACDAKSCKDGTVVTLAGTKTVLTGGEADLPLAAPLHVGDNTFDLMVDRPGMGRDETVRLIVPVAYRVSADVTTMGALHPSVTIRVEARAAATVTVDGKPLALDANGAGAYSIDETTATEGPADESRVLSVDVAYTIAGASPNGGAPDTGKVSARVAVSPLRVDAPGARAVVEDDKVLVAGRAAKGAKVTVEGAAVTVGPDGAFETLVPLPAIGDRTLENPWRHGHADAAFGACRGDARDVPRRRRENVRAAGAEAARLRCGAGGPCGQDRAAHCRRRAGARIASVRAPHARPRRRSPRMRPWAVPHAGHHRPRFGAREGRGAPRLRSGLARLSRTFRANDPRDRERLRDPGGKVTRRAAGAAAAVLAATAAGAVAGAQTMDVQRPRTLVVGTPGIGVRTERIDGSRSGQSATMLPSAAAAGGLRSEWAFALGESLEVPPVVDGRGTTFVVGGRGEAIAVGRDGTEIRRLSTGAIQPGPPALLSDDTLVFSDAAGEAIALREGALRWRVRFGRVDPTRAIPPSPLPLDDGGVVTATTHEMAALDADGHERSRVTLPEPVTSPLLESMGKVVAVTASGAVWTWMPGATEATRVGSFGGPVDDGAALADDHTLVAITSGRLHLSAVDSRARDDDDPRGLTRGPLSRTPCPARRHRVSRASGLRRRPRRRFRRVRLRDLPGPHRDPSATGFDRWRTAAARGRPAHPFDRGSGGYARVRDHRRLGRGSLPGGGRRSFRAYVPRPATRRPRRRASCHSPLASLWPPAGPGR